MESMKNKLVITSIFSVCCYCFWSCSDCKQSKKIDTTTVHDTVNETMDINKINSIKKDSIFKDTILNKKERKETLPEFEDYKSEYKLHYEYYIDKAYDKRTYRNNYKEYKSDYLDSLIREYDRKKEVEDSKHFNND